MYFRHFLKEINDFLIVKRLQHQFELFPLIFDVSLTVHLIIYNVVDELRKHEYQCVTYAVVVILLQLQ